MSNEPILKERYTYMRDTFQNRHELRLVYFLYVDCHKNLLKRPKIMKDKIHDSELICSAISYA